MTISQTARITCALVLWAAALAKLQALYAAPFRLADVGGIDGAQANALLIALEAGLGAALLVPRSPVVVWWLSFLAFSGFSCVAFHRVLEGNSSCGCFGEFEVSPQIMLAVDVVCVVLLLSTDVKQWVVTDQWCRPVFGAALVVSSAGFYWGVADRQMSPVGPGLLAFDENTMLAEPAGWEGKKWPLLNDIVVSADLRTGNWLVVLHRPTCQSCKELHEHINLKLPEELPEELRIAFIQVEWDRQEQLASSSLYVTGRLRDDVRWFVPTPTIIDLQDGVAHRVYEQPEIALVEELLLASSGSSE